MSTREHQRLQDNYAQQQKWLLWGPYLSERQWGTVREDYSANGDAWEYFPHDHARSRAYRWGEDGIAGISDDMCNLCFAVALWNGKDPIIKERLFGLTGPEGNHGEDVKELYYYLDSTPTHSYMKHLYKYPQAAYPYGDIVGTNAKRTKREREYELLDTGIFDDRRYFDVFTEYAKASEEDILIKITVHNRGDQAAELQLLPTLWFRNRWDFGLQQGKPSLKLAATHATYGHIQAQHPTIGDYHLYYETPEQLLFTENETNNQRIFKRPNKSALVKDSINDAIISRDFSRFAGVESGTKCSPVYQLQLAAGEQISVRLRLSKTAIKDHPLDQEFKALFQERTKEADAFYASFVPKGGDADLQNIQRQAFAGMLWTKQYYHIDIPRWLKGDPGMPPVAKSRKKGRNSEWMTLNNEDIISMPDKWEYPWYAAWDSAFHCVPLAMVDAKFAKEQLILFLREWYMRPNGQLPAYEWSFSDVNPPVHAWACMRVYRIEQAQTGVGDIAFLKRVFQKLLINFTWWVNQKDHNENNIFEGGFLGLDNIGIFDRSAEVPGGGYLEQADGTSWMAMYCLNMLDMALEICQEDSSFEDVTTKFLEHFIYIAESLNKLHEDWTSAWNEEEGFFYDILALPGEQYVPIKVRSLVGLSTLFATLVLDKKRLEKVPDFLSRLRWFRNYRIKNESYIVLEELEEGEDILLSLVPRRRLEKLLRALLDEEEFFSPNGIRSLSKIHEQPFTTKIAGQHFSLQYEPGESSNRMFGGNSNWRGPVWLPMNFLLIQSLRELHKYYGDDLKLACPTGDEASRCHLATVADKISTRLIGLFQADEHGRRPVNGEDTIYQKDPYFKDLVLFYEYFHGDNGRGVGASHQTGWTGVVAELIDQVGWG
ncbi:MAG: glucosidase [Bacteroidota bacterium]